MGEKIEDKLEKLFPNNFEKLIKTILEQNNKIFDKTNIIKKNVEKI